MDDLYRDYILEHYRHPHNFGIIEAPDARYEGANPLCGDRITMMLGIRDNPVADPEHHRDAIAAQGIGALVARIRRLDDPEVVGVPVVFEDVVAVEVVHGP